MRGRTVRTVRAVIAMLLLESCSAPGYRNPGDSAELERRIRDRNLETRVRIALTRDPQTAPYDTLQIRCANGVITLGGEVGRPEARARAVHIAQGCRGVKEVVDRMSIRSGRG